jgi:CheY-like chemotaxis protein
MTTDKIPSTLKDKVRILIAEDNVLNQRLAGFMLKEWGFKFDVCANGKLVLEQLAKNKYDLVLMDVQMPEMNGYETTDHIRNNLKLDIPIIATTAHASGAEKKKCLESGMNAYLTKPLRGAELNEILASYLFPQLADIKEQ